ncbi:MAG: Hsp20 family protein [Methanobacteriaceae archaeon]|nr:Hsp20 family protein [Methanobacteriaceae archaeon]MDP3486140.1 Hsp20 family protein [Methanobacteriaceae archaeon]MDP3622678.1 Hsp20 family protein [Methanobacteriaceae archaeon]
MSNIENVSEQSKNLCSGCGSENTETAKFCIECGQNIQINQETESVCYGCGAISPAGVKFCPECGQNLLEQTTPTNTSSSSSSGHLSNLINKKKPITKRKGLTSKLVSDAGKAAYKAKTDIKKSIQDYTLAIEAEITETHDSYIVTVDLPQIKKEDLDIDITPRRINLKAEFDHEVEIEQGTQIVRKEIERGSLNKDILLRKEIVPEKAEAEFDNDLLIIKLPKADIEQGHKLKL